VKKKLLGLFLLVFLLAGSSLAFAWWDNLTVTDDTVTIGVGQGVTIQVNLSDQTTGELIPSTAVQKPGDVTEVVLTYDVDLDVTITGTLNLDVTVDNIEIGGASTLSNLVNVTVNNPGTISNTTVTVTITVTLDEPLNQADYDTIKNSDITFDVTFTATQQ
jgi:hypothetical protein